MKTMRGKFITIEGGEGVGKSSFLKYLTKELSLRGIETVTTREPGGTPTADRIRAIFNHPPENDPLTIEAEAFLVSAARAQHCAKVIEPALQKAIWVLCDRFTDSTRAYQGILGGADPELLEGLIKSSTKNLVPDVTFLLDCPVEISMERVGNRGELKTRYDAASVQVHDNLRQAFLRIAQQFPERFIVIDASLTAAEVGLCALEKLDKHFG